jgi:hypothetical protein
MSLPLYREKVRQLVRDGAEVLDEVDYDFVIGEALKRYSRIKPRGVVAELEGDGGYDYALPAEYDEGFSVVAQVEYPAGRRQPELVDRLDWRVIRTPAGTVLRFLRDTPREGERIWVPFTALHTATDDATTVPAAEHDVIHLVGASLACEALASHFSQQGDSSIGADSVDHKTKAAEYALRAKRFMQLADQLLPITEQGEVRAAGTETSLGDMLGFLTHPTR